MATHSSIFAWEIPWTQELGRLQSMGHKESDMTEWLRHTHICVCVCVCVCVYVFMHGRWPHNFSLYFLEIERFSFASIVWDFCIYWWLHWGFAAEWAFPSCGKQGLLSSCSARASRCSDFSCWGAQGVGTQASGVAACWLSICGAWV